MSNNFITNAMSGLKDHAPAILTGLGVAGSISSVVLAIRATPKALRDIYEHESLTGETTTWKEKVRLTWQYYVPTTAVLGISVASTITAQSLNHRRQAAMMSVYALTETAFREYREKTVEEIGADKESKIRDEIAKDHIEAKPLSKSPVIITGAGEHLCFDSLTGRYFKSDIHKIQDAVNKINSKCLSETYASQNDFYQLIGLDPVVFGDEHGWRFDHLMEVHFSSHLSDDNSTPALSLEYYTSPINGYYKINRY